MLITGIENKKQFEILIFVVDIFTCNFYGKIFFINKFQLYSIRSECERKGMNI